YLNKAVGYSLESYLSDMKKKSKRKTRSAIRRAKEKGEEYFTPHRLQKMQNAWNAST
ncbi:hypothetical protein SAMN05216225_10011, partial [Ornithinibacillus halophilus]